MKTSKFAFEIIWPLITKNRKKIVKSPTVLNVGSAEKMMGQATTMELLYTQTKLNVKSKASDLGGLIYIRPGMARVPSSSFCKFSLKWIAILWKQKPNERGLPKQRHVSLQHWLSPQQPLYTKVRWQNKFFTVPSRKEKTKVNTLVLQSQLIDWDNFFANEKKWRICSFYIWF